MIQAGSKGWYFVVPRLCPLMIWVALLGDAARLWTIHWQTIQAAKKKAVVAIARQLAVYLWRVFTGQVEAEKFGLVYLPEAA